MSYVRDVLGAGESVVYSANYHWIYTAIAILWMVVGLILIVALPGPGIGWVLGFVALLMGLDTLIRKWTTEIAVTTRRFIYKRGWIARRTEEIGLGKLEEINFRQSIFGRILGYGELHLSGTGVGSIKLSAIDDPIELRRAIDAARTKHA